MFDLARDATEAGWMPDRMRRSRLPSF